MMTQVLGSLTPQDWLLLGGSQIYKSPLEVKIPYTSMSVLILTKNRNIVPIHTTKTYTGSSGRVQILLNLGTRWRWMVSLTPQPLYP